MTVSGVNWMHPGDIHVVEGHDTPPLTRNLWIRDSAAPHGGYLAEAKPPEVGVRFLGKYRRRPGDHDITVDRATGVVHVPAPRPTPLLNTFVIEADVTQGRTTHTLSIRVHVHARLDAVWLTPSTPSPSPSDLSASALRVPSGTSTYKFTVLGRFDDGSYADLTDDGSYADRAEGIDPQHGIRWGLEAGSTGVTIHPASGRITAAAAGGAATITARLPERYGSFTCRAQVLVTEAWNIPRPAVHISGPGRDTATIARVANVLFVPDGFTAGDEAHFDRLVHESIDFLKRRYALRPFNVIAQKINFWKTWLPSQERGCSVVHEIAVLYKTGDVFTAAELTRATSAPAQGSDDWSVEDLTAVVGYPTRRDLPGGRVPNQGSEELAAAFSAQKLVWEQLVDRSPLHVTAALYQAWVSLAYRFLLDERDTALGLCFGDHPAEQHSPGRVLGWNGRRATRAQLDSLLVQLYDGTNPSAPGPRVGDTWGSPDGKDRQLVVVLAPGARAGGAQTPERRYSSAAAATWRASAVVAGSCASDDEVRFEVAGSSPAGIHTRMRIVPPDPGRLRPGDRLGALVAHELGHALGLGDEYGGLLETPTPDDVANQIAPFANLQIAGALRDSAGTLDPRKARWGTYHRIAKAGVLTHEPIATASGWELRLETLPPQAFQLNDVIYLRHRPLTPQQLSPRLRLIAPPRRGTLQVRLEAPGTLTPSEWPAGCVVYSPAMHPNRPDEPLTLLSSIVAEHLRSTQRPLNASATGYQCRAPQGPRQNPISIIPAFRARAESRNPAERLDAAGRSWTQFRTPRLIGLYENGAQYSCGVYHASGECLMRDDNVLRTLCHVCRYILVDRLDPTSHGEMDAAYERNYPL
jgi:hypothetical protein